MLFFLLAILVVLLALAVITAVAYLVALRRAVTPSEQPRQETL